MLTGLAELLHHEEIVPTKEEAVPRRIKASPAVAGQMAISLGQIDTDGADTLNMDTKLYIYIYIYIYEIYILFSSYFDIICILYTWSPPTCDMFNIRKHASSHQIPDTSPHTQPHQAGHTRPGHPAGAASRVGEQHHQQD